MCAVANIKNNELIFYSDLCGFLDSQTALWDMKRIQEQARL